MDNHITLTVGNVLGVSLLAVGGIITFKWVTAVMAHSSNSTISKIGIAGQYTLNAA